MYKITPFCCCCFVVVIFIARWLLYLVGWVHFPLSINRSAPLVLLAWLVLLVMAQWMLTVPLDPIPLAGVAHAHLVQQDMPAHTLTKTLKCSASLVHFLLECNHSAPNVQRACKSDTLHVHWLMTHLLCSCTHSCSGCPFIDGSSMVACVPGFYSVGNQSTCTACPKGYECPSQNVATV